MGNSYGDALAIVGDKDNPLWIGKGKDQVDLLDPSLYPVFEVWQKFNAGLGLPGGRPWDEFDPDFIDCLVSLDGYYKAHYGPAAVAKRQRDRLIEMYRMVHFKG